MLVTELQSGVKVSGLLPGQVVEIALVTPSGGAYNVLYRKMDGSYDSVVLFEDGIGKLAICEEGDDRAFDADPNGFLLASEALRIHYSYVFDTRLALHTSIIQPLPHQITAVYEDMLRKPRLRFLLADDPGAGKTIMAGLLIKELMIRGDVERCLIVCPGSLVQQWVEDELGPKFGLEFRMLTNDVIDSTKTGNPFNDLPLLVASMDKLARDDRVREMLMDARWDLVIVDEAHKMSAHVLGRKVGYTKRYRLGQLLSERTRYLLLMTATPHNGKEGDFQEFMKLLDPDLFEGGTRANVPVDLSSVMRRLQKEDLRTFEGKPLFPIREATTVPLALSTGEQALYDHVTEYVRAGFNRAERIVSKDKKNAVGFALTSLQRRLASSPLASFRSLRRRRQKLQERANEVREHGTYTLGNAKFNPDNWDWDEWDSDDVDAEQDTPEGLVILDSATASETLEELEAEIDELIKLENEAKAVYDKREDRKWLGLVELLESKDMRTAEGKREKLIIFTEFTDTLEYLESRLTSYLGSHERLRVIRGGMNRDQRRQVEADFKQDDNVSVLIATDAAGEGINLQVAHLLINYDLPWNPNKIEQRFGRIHRIGQRHTCLMYNLVARGTREGDVWQRLFQKLDQEKETLQGKVFDVLGQLSYDGKSLADLLKESILLEQTPERQAYLDTVIDTALDKAHLQDVMQRDVLATDTLGLEDINRTRAGIERANAMRLQPHYIRNFFENALADLGGRLASNHDGTWRIRRVPLALAVRSSNGARRPLAASYASLAFDKEQVENPGTTDLVCVGHPLLDAAVEETLAKHSESLLRGTFLVDEGNHTLGPRLMLTYSLSICDGNGDDVQRRLYYVEAEGAEEALIYRKAPYIDYRAMTPEERSSLDEDLVWDCLGSARDVEQKAEATVMSECVATDVAKVMSERNATLDRIAKAVEQRLSHAIIRVSQEHQYWTAKAQEGSEGARLQADNRRNELKTLQQRKETRLAELEGQRSIHPKPLQLVSCAVVIPECMLDGVVDENEVQDQEAKKESELRGMRAVTIIERSLGHVPKDVSRENVGWDIESRIPHDGVPDEYLFIESKGVKADADTVHLTSNEVMQAAGNQNQFVLAITKPAGEDAATTTYLIGAIVDTDINGKLSNYPFQIARLEASARESAVYDVNLKDGSCTRKS